MPHAPIDYHLIIQRAGTSRSELFKALIKDLGLGHLSFVSMTPAMHRSIDRHLLNCLGLISGNSSILAKNIKKNEDDEAPCKALAQILKENGLSVKDIVNRLLTNGFREEEICKAIHHAGYEGTPLQFRAYVLLLRDLLAQPTEQPTNDEIQKKIRLEKGRYGWIYIGQSPSYDHLLKIGKTTRKPKKRMAELSGDTGTPFPMSLVFEQFFFDVHKAEKEVHSRLSESRVNKGREFFEVTPVNAIDLIRSIRKELEGTDEVPSLETIRNLEGDQ